MPPVKLFIPLRSKIKRNIKELFDQKKIKITSFSENLGYSRGFFASILGKPDKFFNLEHIEKICEALNYPVHLLFMVQSSDDMVGEPPGTDDYDKAFEEVLMVTEVQMLLGEIGNLPKKMQKHIAQHLLDTVQLMTHRNK